MRYLYHICLYVNPPIDSCLSHRLLGVDWFWLSTRRILQWVWFFSSTLFKVYICLFVSSLHPGNLTSTEVGVLRAWSVMFSLWRSGWFFFFWMPAVFAAESIMQRLRTRHPGVLLSGSDWRIRSLLPLLRLMGFMTAMFHLLSISFILSAQTSCFHFALKQEGHLEFYRG